MSTILESSASTPRKKLGWLEAILDALNAFSEFSVQHQGAVDVSLPQVRRQSATAATGAAKAPGAGGQGARA